jgi:hypothetical protein
VKEGERRQATGESWKKQDAGGKALGALVIAGKGNLSGAESQEEKAGEGQ